MRTYTLLFLTILLTQCVVPEDEPSISFSENSAYAPVLITRNSANSLIKSQSPKSINTPGKFYIYNQFILLVDGHEGVHIFDNTDQTNPINIGFITISNISDVSIYKNVMYANQSTDLVAIDITNPLDVHFLNRIPSISSEFPPDGLFPKTKYTNDRPKNTIVSKWIKETEYLTNEP